MEFVPFVAMLALVWKVVDFLKYLRAGDVRNALTQVIVWAAGVGVVFLYAQSDWADGISVGDQTLAALNGWSLITVGLAIGSSASAVVDAKKAIDGSDSAAVPDL